MTLDYADTVYNELGNFWMRVFIARIDGMVKRIDCDIRMPLEMAAEVSWNIADKSFRRLGLICEKGV